MIPGSGMERSVAACRHPTPAPCASCRECAPLASRRDFLREAASLVAGAVTLAAAPSTALGLTVRLTAALRVMGEEIVYPIPPQDGTTIDRDHEIILVRDQGRLFAFALWCPHQHTALRWQDEERRFQCPKHKSTFQPDGAFISGRATRGMDRHPLRRDGDTVVVDGSTVVQEDKDPERWRQAVVQLEP